MGKGKDMIRRAGWYPWLKYSVLFSLFERLFKPQVRAAHVREFRLYGEMVGATNLVFDIGAYDGHKTAAFLELGAKVVACEPDPKSFALLKVRFRRRKDRVTVLPVALSDRIGSDRLYIHHPGSAFNTLSITWKEILEQDRRRRWDEDLRFAPGGPIDVGTTTLDELIRTYGRPGLIKIDVEGFERKVIEGLNSAVACISFECLLPEFRDDLLFILQKLYALDGTAVFNVVVEEQLIFSEFVGYAAILEWIDTTALHSFDMVVRSGS